MSGEQASSCCCGPGKKSCIGDCIFGTEVDSGCCHKADTLLLWCSRPGFSITQHWLSSGVESCYTTTQAAMDPVQAIYHYHSCRFRFVLPGPGGPVDLIQLPFSGDPLAIGWEACANPICEPTYCPDICCGTQLQPPGGCACNTWYGAGLGGLNDWRYAKLMDDPAYLWFAEMECHKDGDPIDGVAPLRSNFLCMVYFERWWKIAEDCPATDRIYVPGCVQSTEGSNCGGVPFVTSDLVPKWWIFACSGCPLYQFELDEALAFGVIDAGEHQEILDAISNATPPPQPPLFKMARAGYLVAKDWRCEQRQAFLDLDEKFPGEGYAACVEPLNQMDELGPFRKRYTADFGVSARPYLHKDEVVPELDPLQAACMIDFPGGSADDYQYWRERQWVYFRGAPGGWSWVNWNANAGTPYTEEEAIELGYGRNGGTGDPNVLLTAPLEAFRGEPRPPGTCTPCPGVCEEFTYCDACTDDCGSGPVGACFPASSCLRFTVTPYCEGVHFIFSNYVYENDVDPINCVTEGRYRCGYQVHSFLVEAQRSVDSWDDSICYRCRNEIPPLPTFKAWPAVSRAHKGISTICDDIVTGGGVYSVADLCCGGECDGFLDTDYDWPDSPNGCPTVGSGPNVFPCPAQGPQDPCEAANRCPPHGVVARGGKTSQIDCIGYLPDCDI